MDSVTAATVRARALLRLGNPPEATAAATMPADHARDRAELAMLASVAQVRLGNEDAADEALVAARVFAYSSADLALEIEVEFYRALRAFGDGDLASATGICTTALSTAGSPRPLYESTESHGVVPLAHVIARIQELLGLIASAEGRSERQRYWLREALTTFDASPLCDTYQRAFLLRNLVIAMRDHDSHEDEADLVRAVETLSWSEDLERARFIVLEELGWFSALHGRGIEALRRFRQAENFASTHAERALIAANRAVLARAAGYHDAAFEEIEASLDMAQRFRWDNLAGDERGILLVIAQVAASTLPARARDMLTLHGRLRGSMDAVYTSRLEPRYRAEEAFAHGLVLRAETRTAAATDKFEEAFGIWSTIGHEWRAARAALELAELDGGNLYRLALRRDLVARPESFYAARARRVA